MGRYDYNRIFISDQEQETIRNCRVFIGGAASGSVIAECALRLGFEKMTLVDNSSVQMPDLNRHNFTMEDIGHNKAEAVGRRLLSINPDADIRVIDRTINQDNAEALLEGHNIAVNAIDISAESRAETNLAFDNVCENMNITVIHPYNIGFASLVVVVKPGKPRLATLKENGDAAEERFERAVIEYIDRYFDHKANPKIWLDQLLWATVDTKEERLPEMSIAAYIAGGVCTNLLYKLTCGKFVKFFLNFYFYSAKDDMN